jgi:hypothetical protein
MIKSFFNFFSHIHLQVADVSPEKSRSLICTEPLTHKLV